MRRIAGVALLLALASILTGQANQTDRPAFLYVAAGRYDSMAWNRGGERFPAGARLVLVSKDGRRDVAPGFFASADPAVSYDGRQVLFAGRATEREHWQIWEADLAGGAPKLILACTDACIGPLYLPDGRFVYTRVAATGSEIEVASRAGGKADVLTHVPGWYLTDDVLHDGRVLFESRDEIFTEYPDGTGVESLRCDHGPKRASARQIASGDVVFNSAGTLARYRSALAVQEKLPQMNVEISGAVAEIASDRWLVAARPRSVGVYGIYQVAPASGIAQSVESRPGMNAVQPVAMAARVPPRQFPSGLVAARTTGNLLCLDAKESKSPISGVIRSVRVYTQNATGGSRLLGQTTVAPDGSFYVEVPADRPVRMELMDANGVRLQAEEHWFWMRPSEQRICVGCHAGPERAPENKVPEILNLTLTPVRMLGEGGLTQ